MEQYVAKELLQFFNRSVKSCIPIERHTLMFWELTIVLSGHLTYVIDRTEYRVEANDAILVQEGSSRFRYGGSSADYISFNFIAEKDSLSLLRDILYKDMLSREMRTIVSMFPRKSIYWGENCFSVDYERSKTFNILNYILFDMLSTASSKKKSDSVEKAVYFINDNLFTPLSLNDVSKHIALSNEYTSALFKREMGITVTEYIMERKMLYAREALLSRNISLTDLALELGFSNYNYFSRVFKKYYKISPSKYIGYIRSNR